MNPSVAQLQPPTPMRMQAVWLEMDPCAEAGVRKDVLKGALIVELGVAAVLTARTLEPARITDFPTLSLRAWCGSPPLEATLTVRLDNNRQQRVVNLDEISPKARPRAIALVFNELLREVLLRPETNPNGPCAEDPSTCASAISETETETNATPQHSTKNTQTPQKLSAPSPRLPIRPTRKHVRSRDWSRYRFEVQGQLRWFPKRETTLAGADLNAVIDPIKLTLFFLLGKKQDALGNVEIGIVAVSAGVAFISFESNLLRFEAGVRAEIGTGWVNGREDTTITPTPVHARAFDTHLGAAVQSSLEMRLSEHWRANIACLIGIADGPLAQSDERIVGGAKGFFTSALAGIGFGL